MVEKFKVNKEFEMNTLSVTKFEKGEELSIKDDFVMDGCIKMFHKDCDFSKEYGEIVKRLF